MANNCIHSTSDSNVQIRLVLYYILLSLIFMKIAHSNEKYHYCADYIYVKTNDCYIIFRCESWRYFFYRILFKSTPIFMRDRLVQRFVVTPSWKR